MDESGLGLDVGDLGAGSSDLGFGASESGDSLPDYLAEEDFEAALGTPAGLWFEKPSHTCATSAAVHARGQTTRIFSRGGATLYQRVSVCRSIGGLFGPCIRPCLDAP